MDLDSVSVRKHAKKELGQYPAILTSHLVNNPYMSVFFYFRETVSERLKDQEDGVFIVRDSRRFPGEYTLTLRYVEFSVE